MTRFYAIAIGELQPDFVSSAIQRYLTEKHLTPVNWSHCGILVEETPDGIPPGVWDATGRGFEHCTLEEALHGPSVIRHKVELKVRNPAMALGWCYGNRGRWYARAQYVLYFMPAWMRKLCGMVLPGFVKKVFHNGRALQVCSEALDYFMRDNVEGADRLLTDWAGDGDRTDPYQAIMAAYELRDGHPLRL